MRFFIIMLILAGTLLLIRGQIVEQHRNDLNTKLVASQKTVERLRSDSTSMAIDLRLDRAETIIVRHYGSSLPEYLTTVDFPANPYPVPVIDKHNDYPPHFPFITYTNMGSKRALLDYYNENGSLVASREIKL